MKISNIETKKLNDINEDGEISFAIKALVENDFHDDDENVDIVLQGLDSDGFVIHEIDLLGKVPLGTSKVLTEKEDYFSFQTYSKIVDWQAR